MFRLEEVDSRSRIGTRKLKTRKHSQLEDAQESLDRQVLTMNVASAPEISRSVILSLGFMAISALTVEGQDNVQHQPLYLGMTRCFNQSFKLNLPISVSRSLPFLPSRSCRPCFSASINSSFLALTSRSVRLSMYPIPSTTRREFSVG